MRIRTLIGAAAGTIIDVPVHSANQMIDFGQALRPDDPMIPSHIPLPSDDPVLNMAQVQAAKAPKVVAGQTEFVQTAAVDEPPRRRRGRPRKHPLPE